VAGVGCKQCQWGMRGVDAGLKDCGLEVCGAGALSDFSNSCWCWPGLSCTGRQRAKIFNTRRTLVRTNFQQKSSYYDITVVCFHVYLYVFFAKYNITNEQPRTVVLNRKYTYPLGVRSTKTGGTKRQIFRDTPPEHSKKCVVDCCECSNLP